MKPAGPLHPLPIPDKHGNSIAMDFIGPLPEDEGYNCLLTITDRIGSDIRLIPTCTNITADKLVTIFFENWYCENSLPADIVSNHDKLFISKFWHTLHKLTGVHLNLSSFHPEADGASEHSNKMVNQVVRYHVERNQKGWVCAMPMICFNIMNTVNALTGFSGFQLCIGRSPRILLPFVPANLIDGSQASVDAAMIIEWLNNDTTQAHDNLIKAKVNQAHHANKHQGKEIKFEIGDKVMLNTFHRHRDFKAGDKNRVAKFMPHFDGPYIVIHANPSLSSYTIEMPNSPNIFPTFHASELKHFFDNDSSLFPLREHQAPGPVVTNNGIKEFHIDKIIDQWRRGRCFQYLVHWTGYRLKHDRWCAR